MSSKRIARGSQAGMLGGLLLLPPGGETRERAATTAALSDEAAAGHWLLSQCQPAETAFKQIQE